ncbi:MAG: adenylosuccinate lyase, partial [Sphaerochaetaceae bacterium]
MDSFSFDTYISPMTWRYGSTQMRQLWSETWKRKTLRRIWVALARAESKAGLVTEAQVKELESKVNDID